MHLDEGDQAETMEDKQQKNIQVPPGTLRELGNSNFKLTLSSYKTVNLSLFNKALYAHIWNNAASRCITLTMDEINTLLLKQGENFCCLLLTAELYEHYGSAQPSHQKITIHSVM